MNKTDAYDVLKGVVEIPDLKEKFISNVNDKIKMLVHYTKTNYEILEEKQIKSLVTLLEGFNK